MPHDACYDSVARDIGVGKGDVLYGGTDGPAKQCLVLVLVLVGERLAEADATDGVPLAIKDAAEVLVTAIKVAADGGKVLVGAAEAGGAVGDVVAQNEVGATEVRAALHCVGQSIKLGGGGDDVWVLLRATARNAIKNCCTNLIGGSRFSGIIIGF